MEQSNAEQIQYWNEVAGPKWVAYNALIDAQIAPLGRRAMERADVAAGDRVIDVGCGCGETTRELARRVGPAGHVLGIDISAPMLARARESGRELGVTNAVFEQADAQTHAFPPAAFDVLFSRFGIMFFADPPAAFANLRKALRPGGRLAFVCWQALPKNPWLFVPLQAAAPHLTLPPPPAPDAPGPFSFADAERVRGILGGAGFEEIAFEDVQQKLTIGGAGSVDDAVRFLIEGVGPTSAALRDAAPEVRDRVRAAVRDALAPMVTPSGVQAGSAAWIVTARAPAA